MRKKSPKSLSLLLYCDHIYIYHLNLRKSWYFEIKINKQRCRKKRCGTSKFEPNKQDLLYLYMHNYKNEIKIAMNIISSTI